jgi:hypothetical protein
MYKNPTVTEAIYNKCLEVHYNEKVINTPKGQVSIRLQGKIYCKVLNKRITPLVCSKLMDAPSWPRCIDKYVCERQASCFIYKSIQKNSRKRGK